MGRGMKIRVFVGNCEMRRREVEPPVEYQMIWRPGGM